MFQIRRFFVTFKISAFETYLCSFQEWKMGCCEYSPYVR